MVYSLHYEQRRTAEILPPKRLLGIRLFQVTLKLQTPIQSIICFVSGGKTLAVSHSVKSVSEFVEIKADLLNLVSEESPMAAPCVVV